jgi:Rrf2 family transcriptional regulator, nitric oxide-sensitive transcriptional repressor
MISQTAEYALRAMVYLAKQWPEPCTAREIAGVTHVPAGYLSTILGDLARDRLVNSQRGKRGGFVLAGEPDELTLLTIVQAVAPLHRITECPRKVPEHCPQLCPLHQFLDDQIARLHETFGAVTLGQLVTGTPAIFP